MSIGIRMNMKRVVIDFGLEYDSKRMREGAAAAAAAAAISRSMSTGIDISTSTNTSCASKSFYEWPGSVIPVDLSFQEPF